MVLRYHYCCSPIIPSSTSSTSLSLLGSLDGLTRRFWQTGLVLVLVIAGLGGDGPDGFLMLPGVTGVGAVLDDQMRQQGPHVDALRHPGSLVGGDAGNNPVADAVLEQILLDQGRARGGFESPFSPENAGRPPFAGGDDDDFEMDMDGPGEEDSGESPVPRKKALAVDPRGQAEQPFPPPVPHSAAALVQEKRAFAKNTESDMSDTVFIAVTTVCSAAAVFGLMGAGVCWYRLHRRYRSAEEAEYGPSYGITGPAGKQGGGPNGVTGDGKLASSAHLYHYQHTKQQIIAMEQTGMDSKGQESEDSEGEGEEADYSVYECPGLAPTGDIEVSNPLFESSPTSNSPPATGIMTLKEDRKTPESEE